MPILLMLLNYFSFSAFLMPLSRLMKMFWRCNFKCFHFSLFPACFHPHPKWHAPFLVMKMSHFPFQHSIHNKAWVLTISFEKMFGIKVLPRTPHLSKSMAWIKNHNFWHHFLPRNFVLFHMAWPSDFQPKRPLCDWSIFSPIRSFYLCGFFGSTELGVHCACAFPELGVLPGLTQKMFFQSYHLEQNGFKSTM